MGRSLAATRAADINSDPKDYAVRAIISAPHPKVWVPSSTTSNLLVNITESRIGFILIGDSWVKTTRSAKISCS